MALFVAGVCSDSLMYVSYHVREIKLCTELLICRQEMMLLVLLSDLTCFSFLVTFSLR